MILARRKASSPLAHTAAALRTARAVSLRLLHQPCGMRLPARDRWITAAQALAVALVIGYEAAELAGIRWPLDAQQFAPLALFIIPMLYVARGLAPAAAAALAAGVGLLAVLEVVLVRQGLQRWADGLEALIVGTVAICVGWRVEREMRIRRQAEAMRAALAASESRWRALFAQSQAPILIASGDGGIREANAAAAALFARGDAAPLQKEAAGDGASACRMDGAAPTGPEMTGAAPGAARPALCGRSLAELFGPSVAQRLLAGAPPDTITLAARGGGRRVLRPLCTTVADASGAPVVQVLLQDVTAEHRQQQRTGAYAASVLRGQEEERRRIAQDLHDGPIQTLVMLCRRLDALAERHALPAGAAGALEPVRRLAEDVAQELRELARGLRPPSLDDLGLVASLRQLTSRFAARTGIEVVFGVQGEARRLPAEIELGLFRIAQEALRNVERHAAARHVTVRIGFGERRVWLLVHDDGIGFAVPSTPTDLGSAVSKSAGPPAGCRQGPVTLPSSALLLGPTSPAGSGEAMEGLGLLGMQERAALLGGQVVVQSAPGKGTLVRAGIPLAGPAPGKDRELAARQEKAVHSKSSGMPQH